MAEHFFDEEGVAFGLEVEERHQLGRRRLARASLQQRRDLALREAGEHDFFRQALTEEFGQHGGQRPTGLQLGVAIGTDHEDWHLADPLREVTEQQQGWLVGPMEILEDQQQGRTAR